MAAWICGSAKIRANTNASRPASAPTSRPRPISFRSISVTGETDEVASVVHELVDVHVAAEHRRRTLVDADEVVQRQRAERGAGQPQHGLGHRQDNRGRLRRGDGGHQGLLRGSCVPFIVGQVMVWCLTRPHPKARTHSGATVLESHQLPHAITRSGTLRTRSRTVKPPDQAMCSRCEAAHRAVECDPPPSHHGFRCRAPEKHDKAHRNTDRTSVRRPTRATDSLGTMLPTTLSSIDPYLAEAQWRPLAMMNQHLAAR